MQSQLGEAISQLVSAKLPEIGWLDSLIVLKDGETVYESYINGEQDDLRDIYSCTKNCMSFLLGIALDRGVLPSLDVRLVDVFANRLPAQFDKRKSEITLRHCLAMMSGLDYKYDLEFAEFFSSADDPVEFFFSEHIPVAAAPGTTWVYSAVDSQMVAETLVAYAGTSLTELAREWLFGPLGIENFNWLKMLPSEVAKEWPAEPGAMGLQLRTRDLAKVAECVRLGGTWNGETVVPKSWLDEVTAEQPGAEEKVLKDFYASVGLPAIKEMRGYGYHVGRVAITGISNPMLAGMGGQYGFVLPELDACIVQNANFTADGLGGGIELGREVAGVVGGVG